MVHDGHVHSPLCPHGTKDDFVDYCEKAIALGIEGISFTEHAPLPASFDDPTPQQDSGMNPADLPRYIEHIQLVKREYKGRLNILLGLEVDYIEGFEKETADFLNEVGPLLDDSILSVHFLHLRDRYLCLDYSPDVFQSAVDLLGSTAKVHEHYYQTVFASIKADLGRYKPKRIGHMTLARKFQKRFPAPDSQLFAKEITRILTAIQQKGYQLDYNGAGCLKPLCREPYPYASIIEEAVRLKIPLVYGSDAHSANGLLSGYDQLAAAPLAKP
ncbi:histidinol-phosphatase HisJ [Halalkalibacter oceani]|uniref:Histidinol-phosphatase n=1 Tax=Halalkalibacter oceani TaxID=1653776 RepID=A0A9X2IPN7_9BACI|nr:histidinol-phosphatase HisJ [Halalkalibacter oceani]MCM3715011.1 histidinol-phosphatase HisJ [Halalkalibacter oceani]